MLSRLWRLITWYKNEYDARLILWGPGQYNFGKYAVFDQDCQLGQKLERVKLKKLSGFFWVSEIPAQVEKSQNAGFEFVNSAELALLIAHFLGCAPSAAILGGIRSVILLESRWFCHGCRRQCCPFRFFSANFLFLCQVQHRHRFCRFNFIMRSLSAGLRHVLFWFVLRQEDNISR